MYMQTTISLYQIYIKDCKFRSLYMYIHVRTDTYLHVHTFNANFVFRWLKNDSNGVLTCSALKRTYRNILINNNPDVFQSNNNIVFVYLRGDKTTLLKRLETRQGHFMPASLLDSQLETLEEPEDDEHSLAVDIRRDITSIVTEICQFVDKGQQAMN